MLLASWVRIPLLTGMDADSLFMDLSRPLSVLFPRGTASVSFAGDFNCFLNSGHMLFRNSAWSDQFLKHTWDVYPSPLPWNDQSAMVYVLNGRLPLCRERVNSTACCGIACTPLRGSITRCDESDWPGWQRALDGQVDQRVQGEMNSYLDTYVEGDFIIHFAGTSGYKVPLMKVFATLADHGLRTNSSSTLNEFHKVIMRLAGQRRADQQWDTGKRGVVSESREVFRLP